MSGSTFLAVLVIVLGVALIVAGARGSTQEVIDALR